MARPYHFDLGKVRTTGDYPGIYRGLPASLTDALQDAAIRLPRRISSYATPEARDKAMGGLATQLRQLDADTSTVVLIATSEAAMVGGDTRYQLLDGTELDEKGNPVTPAGADRPEPATLTPALAAALAFIAAHPDGRARTTQMQEAGYGTATVAALTDLGLATPGVVPPGRDDTGPVRVLTLTEAGRRAAREFVEATRERLRIGMAQAGDVRFHAVQSGPDEYEIRDYATPSGDLPSTVCSGFHGNPLESVSRDAWEAARRLNSGEDQPDPRWYQPA